MIVTVLLNGVVQGAAIVAISFLAVRCVPERNASTRCALWFVALLALLFVPVLTAVSNVGAQLVEALRPSTSIGGIVISLLPVGTLAHEATRLAAPVTRWIVPAWLIGVGVASARLIASVVRIARIRERSQPFEVRGERVLVSGDVEVPIAVGLLDPAIILPRTIVETLDRSDLERIVAHERAHIRRNDLAWNLIQRLIETVLFFNPWVYVVGRNVMKEREAACDDLAVQSTGTADDYAQCLALLARGVRRRKSPLLTPSALGSNTPVVSRIERLLRNGDGGATSLNYYSIGGTIVVLAILTLALQTLSPASTVAAQMPQATQSNSNIVASACSDPNAGAKVVTPVEPAIPKSVGHVQGFVNILVTIAPSGSVTAATVEHSSGNAQVDSAVMNAAKTSTYVAARRNCAPVKGTYVFHAEFAPQP